MNRQGFVLLSLLCTGAAFAQAPPQLMLAPLPEDRLFELRLNPAFSVSGQTDNGSDIDTNVFRGQGRVLLVPDSRALPRAGFAVTYMNVETNDVRLPDAAMLDIAVGAGSGIYRFKGGRLNDFAVAIDVGVGYASVNPFEDGNGVYGMADLIFFKNINKNERIGVVLNYDGNRTFLPDVPLPGFQYQRTLGEKINIGIGFPITDVQWEPTDWLLLRATYQPLTDVNARVEIRPIPDIDTVGLFASYSRETEAFHWDELTNDNDRLFFFQRLVEAGVIFGDKDGVNVIVAGGYAFDRKFETGFDTRDTDDLAELSDELYFRGAVELRF